MIAIYYVKTTAGIFIPAGVTAQGAKRYATLNGFDVVYDCNHIALFIFINRWKKLS